jgi:hypothetical protein
MFQGGAQFGVIVDECAGDTLKDGTGLAGFATTTNIDDYIKVFGHINEIERLTKNHTERSTIEVLFEALLIDGHIALAGTKIHTGYGTLTTTCS